MTDPSNSSKHSSESSSTAASDQQGAVPPTRTLGSMIGEIVWLMGQSPIHRELAIKDLEWLIMPAVVLGQYKLFRGDNGAPIGAALWAYLSDESEARFKTKGKILPQEWGNGAQLDAEKGLIARSGGTLWLVELIAPFHTKENQHREQMLQDLLGTALNGQKLKMIHVNPDTHKKEEIQVG